MRSHHILSGVLLLLYCLGIFAYGKNWKRVTGMFVAAVVLNTVLQGTFFGIGFTWDAASTVGKILAIALGMSIPFAVSTVAYYVLPQAKKIYVTVAISFFIGLITVLPILVPKHQVSPADFGSLILVCVFTGDCL